MECVGQFTLSKSQKLTSVNEDKEKGGLLCVRGMLNGEAVMRNIVYVLDPKRLALSF